MAKTFR